MLSSPKENEGATMKEPKEVIVLVDEAGSFLRFSENTARVRGEYLAVTLILVYLPLEREVVLFNRGAGAGDMRDHWALTAGKINAVDCGKSARELLGKKIYPTAAVAAGSRELREELGVSTDGTRFELVCSFAFPEKKMFFVMLAWPISKEEVAQLFPDGAEVDKIGRFSLDQFLSNQNLGDAIKFKKETIVNFLSSKFSVA